MRIINIITTIADWSQWLHLQLGQMAIPHASPVPVADWSREWMIRALQSGIPLSPMIVIGGLGLLRRPEYLLITAMTVGNLRQICSARARRRTDVDRRPFRDQYSLSTAADTEPRRRARPPPRAHCTSDKLTVPDSSVSPGVCFSRNSTRAREAALGRGEYRNHQIGTRGRGRGRGRGKRGAFAFAQEGMGSRRGGEHVRVMRVVNVVGIALCRAREAASVSCVVCRVSCVEVVRAPSVPRVENPIRHVCASCRYPSSRMARG
ncbi:hypothetical protein C8Q74DRAFT_411129 [Fomes fomentarius]|nr:hypothetical protein C8Q74DRAFT_411129 [Fomes fomentarius]